MVDKQKKKLGMPRQGDVLIISNAEIPKNVNVVLPSKEGKTVLVEGEATGHAHAFYDSTPIYEAPDKATKFVVLEGGKSNAALLEEWRKDFDFHLNRSQSEKYSALCKAHYETLRQEILNLESPGGFRLLRHEEHWGFLVPGNSEIRRKQEYDWRTKEPRYVTD